MKLSDTPCHCAEIREQIAWGASLSAPECSHVANCPLCTQTVLDFSVLDAQVQEALQDDPKVQVPDDFAERVMARIARPTPDWVESLSARLTVWMGWRPVQIGFASLAFAVAIGNVARFVFALLIPEAA